MTSIFDALTFDVLANHIIPYFNSQALQYFRLVSKAANDMLEKKSSAIGDCNLNGEWTNVKLIGTESQRSRQNIKLELLKAQPDLLDRIAGAWSIICKEDRKPDSLPMLAVYAKQNGKTLVSTSLLPFDLVKGEHLEPTGKAGLGDILVEALWAENTQLAEAVFAHPKANKIPANGAYGLGSALVVAIQTKNLALVQKILTHPNARQIQQEGPCGLDEATKRAENSRNSGIQEYLKSFQQIDA